MTKNRVRPKFIMISSFKNAVLAAAALTIAAGFIVLCLYADIIQQAEVSADHNFRQLSRSASKNFETTLTETINIAEHATYSSACQKYLLSDHAETVIRNKDATLDIMNFISFSMQDAADIMLFSSKGRKLSITNAYSDVAETAMKILNTSSADTFSGLKYSPVIYDGQSSYLVCMLSAAGSADGYRAPENTIVTCIIYDMKNIFDALSLSGYQDCITVLMQDGKIIGNSGAPLSKQLSGLIEDSTAQTIKADDQIWSFYREKIGDSAWEVAWLLPKGHTVSPRLGGLTFFSITALLAISVLMLLLLLIVHKDIAHIVSDLTYHGSENMTLRMPGMKEFQIITTTLSETLQSLKSANAQKAQLAADNYEALLAQKHAKMQAYRSQINPHFLFNTLETTRSLAHHYKIQTLEQLIDGMSQMFRYSLYAPAIVRLSDELKHIEGYLSIISVRFPQRYTVKTEIDQETLSFPVLSMLLQPLVENAIQHGFKGRKHGRILIRTAILSNDRLFIHIMDNGCGISPDKLQAVTKKSNAESSANSCGSGIGLTNICQRLHLALGERASFKIRSRENHYTSIEIIIPR